jgi:hypothetical protein
MTLPIMPCHRGPCCPPAAGVLLLVLALAGCDARLHRIAQAQSEPAEVPARTELIETHSLLRAGVTLSGPVLAPSDAVQRPRVWRE